VFLFGRRPETSSNSRFFRYTGAAASAPMQINIIHSATSASGLICSVDRVAEKGHGNAALILNIHKRTALASYFKTWYSLYLFCTHASFG
jgi:hypothetical protein